MAESMPITSLRSRTLSAMKDEVAAVAIELFSKHGFDNVTVAEIARVAGISPRSFFRYFSTKEDVVLGRFEDAGILIRDALVARPASEGAWEALRNAFHTVLVEPARPPRDLEAVGKIMAETPSIRSRDLEKYRQWEVLLAPDIIQRLAASRPRQEYPEESARAVIGAATTALRVATEEWFKSGGGANPADLFDQLVEAIRA
jgi:AcrR family transcriptional regulator